MGGIVEKKKKQIRKGIRSTQRPTNQFFGSRDSYQDLGPVVRVTSEMDPEEVRIIENHFGGVHKVLINGQPMISCSVGKGNFMSRIPTSHGTSAPPPPRRANRKGLIVD